MSVRMQIRGQEDEIILHMKSVWRGKGSWRQHGWRGRWGEERFVCWLAVRKFGREREKER